MNGGEGVQVKKISFSEGKSLKARTGTRNVGATETSSHEQTGEKEKRERQEVEAGF